MCISLKHAAESFPAKTNMRHCHEKDGKREETLFSARWFELVSRADTLITGTMCETVCKLRWELLFSSISSSQLSFYFLCPYAILFFSSVCNSEWVHESLRAGRRRRRASKKGAKESTAPGRLLVCERCSWTIHQILQSSAGVFSHVRAHSRTRHRLDCIDYPAGRWRRNATYPEMVFLLQLAI